MADARTKIMDMIEGELKKNADVSNAELFEKAKKIDKDVEKLSPRQFNAMYPLQVKRALKPRKRTAKKAKTARSKSRKGRSAAPAGGDNRDRVRAVLLELARDIANAQGKGDVVDVVAGIDGYVGRVMKAAG